jgi:hypothetical protein
LTTGPWSRSTLARHGRTVVVDADELEAAARTRRSSLRRACEQRGRARAESRIID